MFDSIASMSLVLRWIDRAVSMTRGAYDTSFAKLVLLVAYRDSRRSENQGILRYQFHYLARFVLLNSVSTSLRFVGERLVTVWIVLERFVSVCDRFGTVWTVLGTF